MRCLDAALLRPQSPHESASFSIRRASVYTGVLASAKKASKRGPGTEDFDEPVVTDLSATDTSSVSPAMTPLATEADPVEPVTIEEPIAALPEEATDVRFDDKKIETVLVTGATGGVGKYASPHMLFATMVLLW